MPKHRRFLGQKIRLYRKLRIDDAEIPRVAWPLGDAEKPVQPDGKRLRLVDDVFELEHEETISVDALARIARALGVRLEDLFAGV